MPLFQPWLLACQRHTSKGGVAVENSIGLGDKLQRGQVCLGSTPCLQNGYNRYQGLVKGKAA
jgi:hypothetical protein